MSIEKMAKTFATDSQKAQAAEAVSDYLEHYAEAEKETLTLLYNFCSKRNTWDSFSTDAIFEAQHFLKNLIVFFLNPEHAAAFEKRNPSKKALAENLFNLYELIVGFQEETTYAELHLYRLKNQFVTANDAKSTFDYFNKLNAAGAQQEQPGKKFKWETV